MWKRRERNDKVKGQERLEKKKKKPGEENKIERREVKLFW